LITFFSTEFLVFISSFCLLALGRNSKTMLNYSGVHTLALLLI
jgi:hypothetical protein